MNTIQITIPKLKKNIKNILMLSYPLWSFWIIHWISSSYVQQQSSPINSTLGTVIMVLWIAHTIISFAPIMYVSFSNLKIGLNIAFIIIALLMLLLPTIWFVIPILIFGYYFLNKLDLHALKIRQQYLIKVTFILFYICVISIALLMTYATFVLTFYGK